MNIPEATTVQDLQLQNQQLQSALDAALLKVSEFERQLNWFKRQLFGEKSEKRLIIDNPDQIDLDELCYVILEHRRPVVRHKPSQSLSIAAAPSAIFNRCTADVSLLAGMLIEKFVFHLPLHRQHQPIALSSITLSRASLTGWVKRTIELLRPIHQALLASVLQSKILAMNETPVKAGRKEKGKMNKAWFWPVYDDQNEVAFTFSLTRATRHIEPLLKDFSGVLLTDGYGVYDSYSKKRPDITLAQYWVHCRRYFDRAKDDEPAAVEHGLAIIRQLYQIEKCIREAEHTGDIPRNWTHRFGANLLKKHLWTNRGDLTSVCPLTDLRS